MTSGLWLLEATNVCRRLHLTGMPQTCRRHAAVPEQWRRQNGQRSQKYPSARPEISGLAPLPRALRHPAAAAGAAEPAVDPTNDALPLGSALDAQAAAEPPPWRAHRGG